MKRIRVAINAVTELTAKYGSHVYTIELARELSRVETIDLIVLVGRGQKSLLPEELQSAAREVPVSATRSYLQLFCQGRIREILLREQIDIYHIPNTLPLIRGAVPTVITIHDLADLRVRKYGFLRTAYRWLVNYAAANIADHVLTVSENSKRDILRTLKISPDKVTVTYAGVNNQFHSRDRCGCRLHILKAYGIESEFLLATGGFSRNKNIGNLLLAFKELLRSGIQLALVVTGYGRRNEKRRVVRQIKDLNLEDSVILTGYVDACDLPFFYGASSVVIYPSLYEGFGLPVVESMASGAPLVVSNTSSLPEVVGNAGLFVDPNNPIAIADAVRRLLADDNVRQTNISRGLKRAEFFRWDRIVMKTVQVYRDVLSNRAENPEFTKPHENVAGQIEARQQLSIKENRREF
jgi:glycosyltransferase involved in cell wall biosynthesis